MQISADTTATSQVAPNKSDIQLLVLDIDGTIAGESNQIREPVKQAIRAAQARGIQVAIATGRMYCSALRFHQEIGSTLPVMAYQGALIKDPHTQTLHRHWPLDRQRTLQLLEYFEEHYQHQALSIHLYIDDRLHVREITDETRLYAERSGIEPVAVGDLRQVVADEQLSPPTKLLALSHDALLIEHLLTSLQQRYTPAELYFTKSIATFFEAANPQVNKGIAVKHLAEQLLGLQPHQVMAIGDNFNDVEMLQYAGVGIAMGNAPEAVQAVAHWVAPDVEEDGVAVAIAEFIL